MRLQSHKLATVLATAFSVFVVSQFEVVAQTETDALTAIKLATNPTTKLAAAEDFIAKFPNSNARKSSPARS
jgi:hypothetical protein